ncbi:hypothetical protein [Allocoleopsis franciscana]|uniref:Uncharacterized protein n=1 Tax=Allocoleopsis franciscana PCC 7113 TaxID=1173027 RepID=K9WKA3_9CYAN|nr:hypothetical protein [Allocoleopsis franciscana]AFZ20850.1 hypothetical protein Mic7113_5196 [Allocoleopsis franciscana PCC 7113]
MGSGHASHKGNSVKTNTNANNRIDTAADLSVQPEDLLAEGTAVLRAEEAPENQQATQRPQNKE